MITSLQTRLGLLSGNGNGRGQTARNNERPPSETLPDGTERLSNGNRIARVFLIPIRAEGAIQSYRVEKVSSSRVIEAFRQMLEILKEDYGQAPDVPITQRIVTLKSGGAELRIANGGQVHGEGRASLVLALGRNGELPNPPKLAGITHALGTTRHGATFVIDTPELVRDITMLLPQSPAAPVAESAIEF